MEATGEKRCENIQITFDSKHINSFFENVSVSTESESYTAENNNSQFVCLFVKFI